jgi:hypothetical protein
LTQGRLQGFIDDLLQKLEANTPIGVNDAKQGQPPS